MGIYIINLWFYDSLHALFARDSVAIPYIGLCRISSRLIQAVDLRLVNTHQRTKS